MDAGRIEDTDNVQQPTEQMAVVDVVDIEYPTGLKLATVLAAVGLSLILVGLDFNIIATAVPSITTHFNTISDVGWYYSAYRLTACSFQFMFGKMYYLFSVKTVFLVSVVIFEIGSLISAVAPMSSLLILGRAVSGLGCAGIISGVFTIATQSVPLRQRPFFSGLAAGIEGISSTAAPLLGGVLTDSLSWRWCFYINLPLGVITFILVLLFFQDPQPAGHSQRQSLSWKQKAQKLDLLGTAIFLSSITCLLLAIQWGGLTYTWGNARIVVLLCLAVALLAAFVWQERRKGDDALLPGRIMKHRSLLAGMWFSFCNNAALSVVDYYMPTYLQVVRGVSATESGVLCLPIVVGLSLAIFLAGSATSLLGYYVPFMLGTSVLTPIASGLITTLKVHEPLATLICYQGFFGISGGIGFQGPQVAAQTILSTKDSAIGIAVIIFAQNFGPAVFVSVAQTIFTQQLQDYLGSLLPGMDASKLEDLGLSDLKKYIPYSELADVIELYDKALDTTFYLTVGLACASLAGTLAMEWRSIKQKSS